MLSSGTVSPRRTLSSQWSEKNSAHLPLPSSSKPARPLSLPARLKRRWPLIIALIIASFITMSYLSTPTSGLNDSPSWSTSTHHNDAGSGRVGAPGTHGGFEREQHHAAEEDVMATDDLFVQRLEDTKARTPEQVAEDEAAVKVKEEKAKADKHDKLRALVWWIARGGVFPDDYRHPSAGTLAKMIQKEWEELLADVEGTDENVFLDGWVDDADLSQRVTVFSKSYCPFSMRAKDILSEYPIHPDPFIIELDQRDDMSTLQDLLQILTGRRTVPNVLIRFNSVGGADETVLLHHEGVLQRLLSITEGTFQDWTKN